MAICILGDIHFRDDQPYFVATCEAFLNWFKGWSYNKSENTLILAGDLVERAVLSGRTADYLERLAATSNFSAIHIIVGNHDIKRQYGVEQLAYCFYENKPNIYIHKKVESFICEGKAILALPHFNGFTDTGLSMTECYSSLYKSRAFQKHYDLAIGHFCMTDMPFAGHEAVENMDKMNIDKLILGHIHTRNINPSQYIGSVFAGKKSENDNTRAAIIWEKGAWKEEALPIFNEFLEVTYPNALPESKAIVPIYTVLNCGSEQIARDLYKDIYIRKVIKADTEIVGHLKANNMDGSGFSGTINIPEMFTSFIGTKKDLRPKVVDNCKSILGIA